MRNMKLAGRADIITKVCGIIMKIITHAYRAHHGTMLVAVSVLLVDTIRI